MYEIYLALLVLLSSCPIDLQNKFKSVGIKLIYNIIYFYSACQIKCNQTYTYLLPYFKSETKDTNNELMIEQYDMDTNKLVETESDDIHNKLTEELENKSDENIINVIKLILVATLFLCIFSLYNKFSILMIYT